MYNIRSNEVNQTLNNDTGLDLDNPLYGGQMCSDEMYLASYKCDFSEEATAIFKEYHEWVTNSLHSRGIMFAICYSMMMTLALLKVMVHFAHWLPKKKPNYDHLKLTWQNANDVVSDGYTSLALTLSEATGTIRNKGKTNENRPQALTQIRDYLIENNFVLHGKILKKVERRISEDELIKCIRTGEIDKPFTKVQITFGNNMNKVLKDVIGKSINLQTKKLTGETYIIAGDDFNFIKEPLYTIFHKPVKVILDENFKDC